MWQTRKASSNSDHGMTGHSPEKGQEDRSTIPTVWNVVTGPIESIHHGLTRMGIRIRIGQRASLRVRWQSDHGTLSHVEIGQAVAARIAASSVLLGTSGRRPGRDRWNQWTGRVVLVEPNESDGLITVKLHGEPWTLKSTGSVLGLDRWPQTWDEVHVSIDPEEVELGQQAPRSNSAWSPSGSADLPANGALVWLKARVQAIHQTPTQWLVSLRIGDAEVSALVSHVKEPLLRLKPGADAEVLIDQWEAWLKFPGDRLISFSAVWSIRVKSSLRRITRIARHRTSGQLRWLV